MVDDPIPVNIAVGDPVFEAGFVRTVFPRSPTDRLNQRLIQAPIYLSGFDLDVRYKSGKHHTVPDALSTIPGSIKPHQCPTKCLTRCSKIEPTRSLA